MIPKGNPNPTSSRVKEEHPGYPSHISQEDIYNHEEKVPITDPEKPGHKHTSSLPAEDVAAGEFIEGSANHPGSQEFPTGDDENEDPEPDDDEDTFDEDVDDLDDLKNNPDMGGEAISRGQRTGEDLDVPGAELDDDMEELGSEDEENNYYSLGGDNHER
jgi:hypothetical protein